MPDKIDLIYPPFNFVGMPPLGLGYLKSVLEVSGNFSVDILDVNIELYQHCIDFVVEEKLNSGVIRDWNTGAHWYQRCAAAILFNRTHKLENSFKPFAEIIQKFLNQWVIQLLKGKPSIIGISVTDSSFMASLYIAKKIKSHSPGVHIMFGGPLMIKQFAPDYISNFQFIDSILCGEGEASIVQLCEAIVSGETFLNPIPGVLTRNTQNLSMKEPKQLVNLDEIPYPDFSGLKLSLYIGRFYPDIIGKPTLPILANRGCSWAKCAFCSDPFIWPGYRSRTALNVVQEMIHQSQKYRVFNFMFCDLVLNGNLHQLESICDLLMESKYDFVWECMIRVMPIPGRILHKMKAAGCRAIFLGVESLANNILQRMKKGSNKQLILKMIKEIISHDIFLRFNLITQFPGETLDDVKRTFEILMEHEACLKGKCEIFLSPFTLTYGSPLWYKKDQLDISWDDKKYSNIVPTSILKRIPSYEYKPDLNPSKSKKTQQEKKILWGKIKSTLEYLKGDLTEYKRNEYYLELKDFVVIYKKTCFIVLDGDISPGLFLYIKKKGYSTGKEIFERFACYDVNIIREKLNELMRLGIIDRKKDFFLTAIPHWGQNS
jgi:radical SAM superfamily enzyme YgiQ (UPF0313 family)